MKTYLNLSLVCVQVKIIVTGNVLFEVQYDFYFPFIFTAALVKSRSMLHYKQKASK